MFCPYSTPLSPVSLTNTASASDKCQENRRHLVFSHEDADAISRHRSSSHTTAVPIVANVSGGEEKRKGGLLDYFKPTNDMPAKSSFLLYSPKRLQRLQRLDKLTKCNSSDGAQNAVTRAMSEPDPLSSARLSYDLSSSDQKKKVRHIQLYLDLGQKNFGHCICTVCSMTYAKGNEDDETLHARFHRSFLDGLRFFGWKDECVIAKTKGKHP
jgi:hypothetical protein